MKKTELRKKILENDSFFYDSTISRTSFAFDGIKKTPLFKPIYANQTKPTITITHPKPWTLPGSSQLLC